MIFRTRICIDWDANYSSQVFNSLFQSQLWSIVTSGGSAFHNISWRHTATTPHCDYSWHGTTPGPQRSWAESRRLLLAWDYSWPVTPVPVQSSYCASTCPVHVTQPMLFFVANAPNHIHGLSRKPMVDPHRSKLVYLYLLPLAI